MVLPCDCKESIPSIEKLLGNENKDSIIKRYYQGLKHTRNLLYPLSSCYWSVTYLACCMLLFEISCCLREVMFCAMGQPTQRAQKYGNSELSTYLRVIVFIFSSSGLLHKQQYKYNHMKHMDA